MKISVITVSYNSEKYIGSAIESVINQSFEDVEYIIVDGGSKDKTISTVESFGSQIEKMVSEPDRGIYDAMNKGLLMATGDVIGILNSDDFYPNSDVLFQVSRHFDLNPNADMVIGNVDFVKPEKISTPVRFYSSFGFLPWKMRFGFMPAHPAAFIRRSAYEKVGFYKLDYKIGADFEWFVRGFLLHRLSYIKLNQTFVRMREGGVSTSGFKSYWLSSKEQLKALRSNGIYSNWLFVLLRLPIKFLQKIFKKQ